MRTLWHHTEGREEGEKQREREREIVITVDYKIRIPKLPMTNSKINKILISWLGSKNGQYLTDVCLTDIHILDLQLSLIAMWIEFIFIMKVQI
jgi:hypothetical protein